MTAGIVLLAAIAVFGLAWALNIGGMASAMNSRRAPEAQSLSSVRSVGAGIALGGLVVLVLVLVL